MADIVHCPECDAALRPKQLGVKVRCPKCQHVFTAGARPDDEDEAPARQITTKAPARRPAVEDRDEDEETPRRKPVKRAARDEEEDEDDRPRRRRAWEDDDDEDDRPRRKRKRRKKSNMSGLVGLIVLGAVVPIGMLLFLLSFWSEFATGLGIFLGVVAMIAGGIMTWVVIKQQGGELGLDNVPWVLRGGAAILVLQIKWAIEMPGLLAAWVGLEVYGLILMIACACVHGALYAH